MIRVFFYIGIASLVFSGCSTDIPTPPSFEEQLKKDVAIIDAYLTSNSINATVDPSGVRYLVTVVGTGEKLESTETAYVSVLGKVLTTGVVFFDTKGSYVASPLGDPNNLECLRIVLPLVTKGSSLTIYSPSGLAYGGGSSADGTLPPNANVSFEMQLFDEVAQFKLDTAAISAYVEANNINAIKDASGLQYVITEPGTGAKPIASSTVTFNYEGKLLATGVVFDKSTTVPLTLLLTNVIKGLQIGFPLLSVGAKATFYIPSSLGYGPPRNSSIPGNSSLIFEIELVSVR